MRRMPVAPFVPLEPGSCFDAAVSVDVLYHRSVSDDARGWMRSDLDIVVHKMRRHTRRRGVALAGRAGLRVARASDLSVFAALRQQQTGAAPAPC
jgi:hypothetical protein